MNSRKIGKIKQTNKIPNFLLVAAPKTGSSSMVRYLRQHPQIFFSHPGEPRYFISEIIDRLPKIDPMRKWLLNSSYLNWNSYIELFSDAKSSEIRLGEGTTQYLYYHKEVIPRIKEKLGDIPIIILLRNPIERAFSNYNYHKTVQLYSFEQTLKLEKKRKELGYFSFWLCKTQGNYYQQVKAYIDNFSRVFIALTDDLRKTPTELMKNIYQFLDVDSDYIPDFNLKNISKTPKNHAYRFILFLKHHSKLKLPFINSSLKSKVINSLYTYSIEPMKTSIKIDLIKYYYDDIKKLEQLIKRDLSNWYKNAQ